MSELNRYVQPGSPDAEVFVEPSTEAKRLVRLLGWLVAPKDGRGNLLSRAIGVMVVSPFTQFTFFSFDLQAFLYEVFHTRFQARLGHFLFMPAVNFWVMVALAQVSFFGPHPPGHEFELYGPNGATLYAVVLLVWYAAMAAVTRMWLWWLVMVPVVVGLGMGANALYNQNFILEAAERVWYAPTPLPLNPFLWMGVSAFLIALSHLPEPLLPPRVNETRQWLSLSEYVLGPPGARHPRGRQVVRALRAVLQSVWGTLDEWWASPRLMPYGFLFLMFRAGYQPARKAALDEHVRRAVASGNPALDYVGIGGGTFLRLPAQATSGSEEVEVSPA